MRRRPRGVVRLCLPAAGRDFPAGAGESETTKALRPLFAVGGFGYSTDRAAYDLTDAHGERGCPRHGFVPTIVRP